MKRCSLRAVVGEIRTERKRPRSGGGKIWGSSVEGRVVVVVVMKNGGDGLLGTCVVKDPCRGQVAARAAPGAREGR